MVVVRPTQAGSLRHVATAPGAGRLLPGSGRSRHLSSQRALLLRPSHQAPYVSSYERGSQGEPPSPEKDSLRAQMAAAKLDPKNRDARTELASVQAAIKAQAASEKAAFAEKFGASAEKAVSREEAKEAAKKREEAKKLLEQEAERERAAHVVHVLPGAAPLAERLLVAHVRPLGGGLRQEAALAAERGDRRVGVVEQPIPEELGGAVADERVPFHLAEAEAAVARAPSVGCRDSIMTGPRLRPWALSKAMCRRRW